MYLSAPTPLGTLPTTLQDLCLEQGFDPTAQAWVALDRVDPLGSDVPDALSALGLGLRPWQLQDAGAFALLYNEARMWTYLAEPAPAAFGPEQARALIALSHQRPDQIIRALVWRGQPVGQVRLAMDPGEVNVGASAEISYWLAPAVWGQGFGRALVAAASARAFARSPDLMRLVAKLDPANTASARALAASGYRPARAYGPAPEGWVWRVRYR